MSNPTGKKKSHQRKKPRGDKLAQPRTSDTSRYIVFIMIGLAIVGLGWLATEEHLWREFALGYLVVIAWMMNINAIHAYRGRHLAQWQQALARLPLRLAGFGTKHGKPLEGAHGSGRALRMIWVSVVGSLVILAGLFVFFFGKQIW